MSALSASERKSVSLPTPCLAMHNFRKVPESVSHEPLAMIWHPTFLSSPVLAFSGNVFFSCLQVACNCCYISTTSDHSRLQWIQYIATDALQVCPCLCCSLWHQQCMKSSSIVSTYELQVSILWLESWYLHWICFNQCNSLLHSLT